MTVVPPRAGSDAEQNLQRNVCRRPRRAALLALTLFFSISFEAIPDARQQQQRRPGAVDQTASVVFAVQRYGPGEEVIDPVVLVGPKGELTAPPVNGDAADEASRANQFIGKFFSAGRKYRLLSGGAEAGSLVVVKYQEPGCTGLTASAKVESPVKLGGQVHALATDSAKLGGRTNARRAPTDAERAAALDLARRAFRANREAATRVAKLKTNNLTAIDLDGDGRAEMVGSYYIEGEFGVESAVYLIAEPKGAAFAPAMTWYARGSEADSQYRRLVDAVDLDGDGTMEVLTQGIYYESHDYMIYKKQGRAWRVVYRGGGGRVLKAVKSDERGAVRRKVKRLPLMPVTHHFDPPDFSTCGNPRRSKSVLQSKVRVL
jgi:hypothetical protein